MNVSVPFLMGKAMREEFAAAVKTNSPTFGIALDADQIERLADYYELVMGHNELLHLVAPCSAEEFAVRHILESLMMLRHLPPKAKFADVGTGAGLPALPCLLIRSDLSARLIESKERKARFLVAAVEALGLSPRAQIINRQFAEASPGDAGYVTCRALDKFTEKLPALVRWAKRRQLLLFGGKNLSEAVRKQGLAFVPELLPLSEQRYLFVVSQ